MAKVDKDAKKAAFEAAKQEFKAAKESFEANVTAAQAELDAGTLTPEGFAELLAAETALLRAAQRTYVAAIMSAHGKPSKDRKPKPAPVSVES